MVELRWDGNDFRNSQDSSGTVADNISRNGKLQQGYKHGSLTEGLVAYYPMEKGNGQILHDGAFDNLGQIKPGSSGGNTKASDMWTTSSKVGNNTLQFDGTDDHVTMPPCTDDKTELTVSAWVYKESTGDWNVVISNTGTSSATMSYSLRINTNDKADFAIYDGSTFVNISGNTTLSTSNWYHLTGRYSKSDGELKVYVNGTQEGKTSTTINPLSAPEQNIGRSAQDGRYFQGKIDDVRIYDRTLSEPEIKALANNTKTSGVLRKEKNVPGQSEGGISRYKLNGTADDSWGDNHGTNNGANLTTTGVHGDAGEFVESEDDSIGVGEVITDDQNNVTISAWAKLDSINNNPRIFGGAGANEEGVTLFVESDRTPRFYVATKDTDADLDSNTNIPNNEWVHYVATYNSDTGTARLYLNGSIDMKTTGSGNIANTELSQQIGTRGGRDTLQDTWDGKIDDVRIYNQALTPLQVEKLFHKGAYRISRSDTLH